MNTEILDKQVIIIDSDKCTLLDNTKLDFNFNLLSPIRNVLYIKIIERYVVIDGSTINNGIVDNNSSIDNLDSINIKINNYNRIIFINNKNNNSLNEYFDTITIDTSKYNTYNFGTNYTFKNDYSTDTDINSHSMYVLNPIEPSLKRFNITVSNNSNTLLDTTKIKRVIIKICVYTNRMKLTMN